MLIGLDLDNTIIDYDAAFSRLGQSMGLLPVGFEGPKLAARTLLWRQPEGDLLWQRLQAAVYGPGIGEASPADGVHAFMTWCRGQGHDLSIVSHKSQFAAADPQGSDLRVCARAWLEQAGIAGALVAPEAVYFEDTRRAKLERIAGLGCRYFVDDLEEVLLDPAFPHETQAIHFAPTPGEAAARGLPCFPSWQQIAGYIENDSIRSRP